MVKKKKKIDIELTDAQSVDDALNYIFIGIKYFMKAHPKKTLVVILGVIIGFSSFFGKYLTSDTIQILNNARPKAMPTGQLYQSNPFILYAQTKQQKSENWIVFGGEYYGEEDKDWEIKKVKDQNVVLVYNKKIGTVKEGELPFSKLK